MKREKFSRRGNYRYVVPDPSKPGAQINEAIPGETYALLYSFGYWSAYGRLGSDVPAAHSNVPVLDVAFVRKVWDEGMKAGMLDKAGGVPAPETGLAPFLQD